MSVKEIHPHQKKSISFLHFSDQDSSFDDTEDEGDGEEGFEK